MKYFTKDYFKKRSYLTCLDDYIPFADEKCAHFDSVYQERLKERLIKAEKDFNTPIEMNETREDIIKTYSPKKYPIYDFVAKRIVGYSSLEMVLKSYDDKVIKLQEQFDKRGTFDKNRIIHLFEDSYQEKLQKGDDFLPEPFQGKIDPRLLALGIIPTSIYNEIQNYLIDLNKSLIDIETTYKQEEETLLSTLGKDIQDFVMERKDKMVMLVKEDEGLSFYTHNSGLKKMGQSGFKKYLFKEGQCLVKDENLPFFEAFERKTRYDNYFEFKAIEVDKVNDHIVFDILFEDSKKELSELKFSFLQLDSIQNY